MEDFVANCFLRELWWNSNPNQNLDLVCFMHYLKIINTVLTNEEPISETSYIHSYMLLICRSDHSKEANFQHKIYCKWKMLILTEI